MTLIRVKKVGDSYHITAWELIDSGFNVSLYEEVPTEKIFRSGLSDDV